jgi:transposase
VKDAEWIADLLRHGLIRGSVIPDRPRRDLRELVRYRTSLQRQRAQAALRIQKVLEGANLTLSSIVADILGVSSRAMLEALVAGTDDPVALAGLARGRLQKKRPELVAAREGQLRSHQRLVIASILRLVDVLDAEIATLDAAIAEHLQAEQEHLDRIDAIPGIGRRLAEVLIAEIGSDVRRFPSAAQLASWARICPGNHQSAGKQRSGHTGAGNPW